MNTYYAETRTKWRSWLEKNHQSADEVWLIYYKKHTNKACITYNASLEEALCYGWIDGLIKRLDEEKYVRRFSPRKPNSIWSETNRKIVEKLIAENKITKYGLVKVEEAKKNGKWEEAYNMQSKNTMPDDLKQAMMANQQAWNNFQAFTQSQRSRYIYWINTAKRQETRDKRISTVVENARNNIKPTM